MSTFVCRVPSDVFVPPRFIVNLDLPPAERWRHIARLYIDQVREAEKSIETLVSTMIGQWQASIVENVLSTIMAGITRLGLVFYGQELKGFANDTGIDLGKLVLMQFVYECTACCTSIVCQNTETGTPMHMRTMDWEMDFLKSLTIDVDFQRKNQTVFRATTWVGYVGILTGMRVENGYSVSVNFRNTNGQLTTNLKAAITYAWPLGFLVREILESIHSYNEAVEQLAQSSIIAPCYFTICGTIQNTTIGTLLTRRQETEEKRWTVSEQGLIVQTNIDHWSSDQQEDILYSIRRRALAKEMLSAMTTINEYEMWKLVSEFPICNEETIYGTFMCPEYSIYHTRFPILKGKFHSQEKPEYILLADIKDDSYWRLSLTYDCSKCEREFNINDNPGGGCLHTGTWHAAYNDCSLLKCGFHLSKQGSIGKQHWSCCYSLNFSSKFCDNSLPHTFVQRT